MSDLDSRELAQLGLKHIDDAIVALLSRHGDGLRLGEIAEVLGLGSDLDETRRAGVAAGILELLVRSGRIRFDEQTGCYRDNPDMV